jgi:hypothetical protein
MSQRHLHEEVAGYCAFFYISACANASTADVIYSKGKPTYYYNQPTAVSCKNIPGVGVVNVPSHKREYKVSKTTYSGSGMKVLNLNIFPHISAKNQLIRMFCYAIYSVSWKMQSKFFRGGGSFAESMLHFQKLASIS